MYNKMLQCLQKQWRTVVLPGRSLCIGPGLENRVLADVVFDDERDLLAQHAFSSEKGRDFPSLTPAAAHRATASHSQATRHPQTPRGRRTILLFRHRGRPTAVHARIAATHQRAHSPFFHLHSGYQRPHTGLMQHSPAAGSSWFSSTRGLGLTGAEPPRPGVWDQLRATRRARNLLKLAQRARPGTCRDRQILMRSIPSTFPCHLPPRSA